MWEAEGAAHAGAAKRRRERRHRAYSKYPRMSVAMALSEYKHHTSRGQKMDRAGGGVRDAVHDDVLEALLTQEPLRLMMMTVCRSSGAPGMTASTRSGRRSGYSGAPCSRLSTSPLCRLSMILRRRWCNSCQISCNSFGRSHLIPSRLSKCPRFLPEDVSLRTAVREPQLAEQMVDVPTIVSYSWMQLRVEQNVDIPVPGRGGRIAGLQGFFPGQSSTALPSEERISERIVEQNVDFTVGGGLQDFRPGQSSSSSSHVPARVSEALDEDGEGFILHFSPKVKKMRSWVRTRGRNCSPSRAHPRRQLMGITGSMATTSGSALTLCTILLEEVAVRPRSVAPAVGTALTAAR